MARARKASALLQKPEEEVFRQDTAGEHRLLLLGRGRKHVGAHLAEELANFVASHPSHKKRS